MDILATGAAPISFLAMTDFPLSGGIAFLMPVLPAITDPSYNTASKASVSYWQLQSPQLIYSLKTSNHVGVGGATGSFPVQYLTLLCGNGGDAATAAANVEFRLDYDPARGTSYNPLLTGLIVTSSAQGDATSIYDLSTHGRTVNIGLQFSNPRLRNIDNCAGTFSGFTLVAYPNVLQISFPLGNSATISAGTTTTIPYGAIGAVRMVVDQGVGAVASNSQGGQTIFVSPSKTTVYTFTATACDGTTVSLAYTLTVSGSALSALAMHLTTDAHRRPCAVACAALDAQGRQPLTGYASQDAGHTYLPSVISADARDPSLLVDLRRGSYRVICSTGAGSAMALMSMAGTLGDGFAQSAAGLVPVTSNSGAAMRGGFAAACQHPTDADYALLVFSQIFNVNDTSMQCAYSIDGGATWTIPTVPPGKIGIQGGGDLRTLAPKGRPALAFSGNAVIVATNDYSYGGTPQKNNVYSQVSFDRGMTWRNSTILTATGPYQCLSMIARQGRFYLLAFTLPDPASASIPTPVLLVSPDLGTTWAQVASAFPAITPPSGIGIMPLTGKLRLGLTHVSSDDGRTWTAA